MKGSAHYTQYPLTFDSLVALITIKPPLLVLQNFQYLYVPHWYDYVTDTSTIIGGTLARK